MSDKDLQRLTELVSYIGQAVVQRLVLLPRHHHATPKVKIAGKRTLHLSVHEDGRPAEIFLRMEGLDYSSELIGLYGVIARLISLTLQYGSALEKVGELLTGVKFERCSPVSGPDGLQHSSGLPDLKGRHQLSRQAECAQ